MTHYRSGDPFRSRYEALAAEQAEIVAAMEALIVLVGAR